MPESSTIPNCVQVRLLWAYGVNGAVNVLHAIAPAQYQVSQANADALGAAIKSAYTTNLAPSQHTSTSLVRVGLRDRRIPNGAEFLDTGAAVSGTAPVSDPLAPQTAMCLTFRTAGAGKSYRGRIYFGGYSEGENTASGQASSTARTNTLNFVAAIRAALTNNGGLTHGVASRGANYTTVVATERLQDGTTQQRTLYTIKDKSAMINAVNAVVSRGDGWETQRRRNNGRGSLPTVFNPATEIH